MRLVYQETVRIVVTQYETTACATEDLNCVLLVDIARYRDQITSVLSANAEELKETQVRGTVRSS